MSSRAAGIPTRIASRGDKWSVGRYEAEFPSAGYLVFGWGARDYYMARNPGIGDILRAVASGPAVMLVFHSKSPLKRFSGFRTLLLSMCRRVVSNVSRSCCGTIWLQTRKGLPAALVPVSIPKASSRPPLERTFLAAPTTHGRPRRCRLPACQ